MVAKATVMQFHLFKDAKDPFCGLAAARGASWVFFLLLSLFFCLLAPVGGDFTDFSAMVLDSWCFSYFAAVSRQLRCG